MYHETLILENKLSELLDDRVSFLDMNISNTAHILIMSVHAASSTDKRDYILDEQSIKNIELGASNFTKLILKKPKGIKILYCSSGAVYGQQPHYLKNILNHVNYWT